MIREVQPPSEWKSRVWLALVIGNTLKAEGSTGQTWLERTLEYLVSGYRKQVQLFVLFF